MAISLYDASVLSYLVQQVAFHSVGAIAAMRSGVLEFGAPRPQHDYAGLQALIADSTAELKALKPVEVDAFAGKDVAFRVPGKGDRVFTAEGFLMSFSLPNFHFHATTAYDILRMKGAPLGKLDFMGALRLKG